MIAVAPRANLQAAANPAQTFRRVRRTWRPADDAPAGQVQFVRFKRKLGLFENLVVHYWRLRTGQFAFHLNFYSSTAVKQDCGAMVTPLARAT